MNKRNVEKLIRALETGIDHNGKHVYFSMHRYFSKWGKPYKKIPDGLWYGSECGTTACIGGHAAILSGKLIEDDIGMTIRAAKEWLGLSETEADALFIPPTEEFPKGKSWLDITRAEAVKVLTEFLNTGIIDWSTAWED